MLNVKTFKDGERTILCIEGGKAQTLELIKTICSQMIDVEFEEVDDAFVKPLPEEEFVAPVEEQSMSEETINEPESNVICITDGNYVGKTPLEIVSGEDPKANEKAFKELVVLRHNCEEPLKTEINGAIMTYVKTRFAGIADSSKYVEKLTMKHLINFFDDNSFGGIIPKKKKAEFSKESGFESWENFISDLLEQKEDCLIKARQIALKTIEMFKR